LGGTPMDLNGKPAPLREGGMPWGAGRLDPTDLDLKISSQQFMQS
jgi:hypothetical protein